MFEIIFIILKRKRYLFVALLTFAIMTVASYYLTVSNVFHKDILIYAQMNGFLFTLISLLLGLFISVLFGFYIALLIFRKDMAVKSISKDKLTSFAGTSANIVASGCPSCGVPLLGLIGLPLGLSYLPFKGLELKIISAVFLLISISYISKNIRKSLKCGLGKRN
ncbi:MAG: hypothetical protein P1P85_04800 [Patescibacteria group bacterium]|nr:hypothetical protein [Patescibacteria group bacterium]